MPPWDATLQTWFAQSIAFAPRPCASDRQFPPVAPPPARSAGRHRHEADLARAAEADLAALPGVIDSPAPVAVSQRFGDSGVELLIQFWVDTGQVGLLQAQDAAIQAVKRALDEARIRLPYPTRMMVQPQA